jgi:hypothetical protein
MNTHPSLLTPVCDGYIGHYKQHQMRKLHCAEGLGYEASAVIWCDPFKGTSA